MVQRPIMIASNQRHKPGPLLSVDKGSKEMIGLRTIEESCPLDSSLLWSVQR